MNLKSIFQKLTKRQQKQAAPLPPQAAEADRYFVRFSSSADLDKINEFYDFNTHKSVRKRQNDLVAQLAADGAIVLIEDAAGNVVASSITYAHHKADADGLDHIKWQEFGTTRIVLNGFPGLFDAMVVMQTLRTFLVEPPEDKFVAQMHTDPVQKMAGKLGWRPYVASEELKQSKKNTVNPEDVANANVDINWFFCGVEAMPTMASYMARAMENPVLENKKTGAKIQLDFSKSTFFTMFAPEIRALAQNNLGDVEHPDMKRGIADSRNKWMKKFFR